MKKMSLLFVTLLMLMSSIIFCACGNNYKKLSIELSSITYQSETFYAEEGKIGLVIDEPYLSNCLVEFKLTGAKRWGEVSVTSSPAEAIKVELCETDGKTCSVIISALQPVESGELIITHLGSGKNCKVPLTIGKKLQSISVKNSLYVLERPTFVEGEEVKTFEIPTKDLLSCEPSNYTNIIAWKQIGEAVSGVTIVSYDRNGEEVKDEDLSSAVKSLVWIDKSCNKTTTITMSPVSILDGVVTEHDKEVKLHITELLNEDDIIVTSETHGDDNKILQAQGLSLISNPNNDESPRYNIAGYEGYDLYSTAVVEFKVKNPDKTGDEYISLLSQNSLFESFYNITISSDIPDLLLEYLTFGKIRAIATTSCYGYGNIKVLFTPKNSAGDIRSFEINIPCIVGERATTFSVVNNGRKVELGEGRNNFDFEATTALNDSNSVGQSFRFEVLSTNTLSALKQYRISIHKNLLYNTSKVLEGAYSANKKKDEYNTYTGENIGNLYQISILKDGNETYFYHESADSDYFVSEPLSSRNTIYIKWISNIEKQLNDGLDFGIYISNWYNGQYDTIVDNKFDETQIALKLNFNRQRTVGSIDYLPVKSTYQNQNTGTMWDNKSADDASNDWQFYLSNNMLGNNVTEFYGFKIKDVWGLGKESLNDDEKNNINVEVTTNCSNLGFAVLDTSKDDIEFTNILTYNYAEDSTIILLGKIDRTKTIECGEYSIEFRQKGSDVKDKPLIKRELTIYEPLTETDVKIDIPLADFRGNVLSFALATGVTADNYMNYYIYKDGKYVKADAYNSNTDYYQEIALQALEEGFNVDDVYVLATTGEYVVDIEYTNTNFIGYKELTDEASVLGTLNDDYVKSFSAKDAKGNLIVKTGLEGSFNTETSQANFVKIDYTISLYKYEYYKKSEDTYEIPKTVVIYVYEPVTKAVLDKTNIEKYSYNAISNTDLRDEYGTESLTLELNNGNSNILNYVDVKWSKIGNGVTVIPDNNNENVCNFEFTNSINNKYVGRLIATINQFGIQIPVYCSYSVVNPVLSDRVELNTKVNTFMSGDAYINLKVGETKQFDASVKGVDDKPASFDMVKYIVCTQSGYKADGVAEVTNYGLLQAVNPGKAKLLIVAKDRWPESNSINNYLDYVKENAIPYVAVDIIVSNGTVDNPYLIANSGDFAKIGEDFKDNVNKNHYALVSNINLNGKGVTFNGDFAGSISSYKQNVNDTTRFRIAGIMLTATNPTVFSNLTGIIDNLDFVVDINYTNTITDASEISICLVGNNKGLIKDITVISDGRVTVSGNGIYTIGSLVAINEGTISLTNPKLVAVEASITVDGDNTSTIVIGGIVGKNIGSITGAQTSSYSDNEGMYSNIYYGKEGITAYVNLTVNLSNQGALGGAIGDNAGGTVTNVLTDGTVKGVNNVGGIIGTNSQDTNLSATIEITSKEDSLLTLDSAEFDTEKFQINNSYSTAKVSGDINVGGAVGYDKNGSYKKVYYEMYTSGEGVIGSENVGGLIGYAQDSDLLYCYANNFGWGYKSKDQITTYDIIGDKNVGGLIGYADSTGDTPDNNGFYMGAVVTIISSAASVTIKGNEKVAGLIGLLEDEVNNVSADGKFAAIYTAYYYGIINSDTYHGVVNCSNTIPTPYNNVYGFVNDVKNIDLILKPSEGQYIGFKEDIQNNGKPYVVDNNGNNIINPVPTIIKFNNALMAWTEYDGTERGVVIKTGDNNSNESDYREKALLLYYYGISDMSDEYSLDAYNKYNKVNMHDIVKDDGIIVIPATLKRFNLSSSNPSVARVLDDGWLMLVNEGQTIITLTSIINPSVSASFVVIVRTKVDVFTLHSSANLYSEFDVDGDELIIVNGSSKMLYPNVKSSVKYFKTYEYKPATNMGTEFTITCDGNINLDAYISVNGEKQSNSTTTELVYRIPFNTPITITVKDYCKHSFNVKAKPYVVVNYVADNGESKSLIEYVSLSKYPEFKISTKQGASAINANKHHIVMMPADSETNLDVKISTDTKQTEVYIDVEAIGDWEVQNPLVANGLIKVVDMLTISGLALVDLNGSDDGNAKYNYDKSIKTYCLDLDGTNLSNNLQEFKLQLKLNKDSYYIDKPLKLGITIYLLDDNGNKIKLNGQVVQSRTSVDIEPQTISSMIARNYRVSDNTITDTNLKQSTIIRPGSTNIIDINVAPNIAVYDYIEIIDTSTTESILFRQVYKTSSGQYTTHSNMDEWVEKGIKLQKIGNDGNIKMDVSQLFVEARLPKNSVANVTHTITIVAYNKNGQAISTAYLDVEAIAYPTVIMTYTEPNGTQIVANTSEVDDISGDSSGKIVVKAKKSADLAIGVEAGINVDTINIDEGSLKYDIKIFNGQEEDKTSDFQGVFKLDYKHGKYILLFNREYESKWNDLLNYKVQVIFTASKSLNGSIEYCEAMIEFIMRKFVIYGISMTHLSSQGDLYGDWDEDESYGSTTQFYFDKTDISYYNLGYWNVEYHLKDDSAFEGIKDNNIKNDLIAINEILKDFNNGWTTKKTIRLIDLKDDSNNEKLTEDVDFEQATNSEGETIDTGFRIVNSNNSFTINAKDPKIAGGKNINDYKLRVEFKSGFYDANGYPSISDEKTLSNEFGFNFSKRTTPFDDYITINSQAEFEDMLEGKFYKLGQSIELKNYTPVNVAIGGFNGGEHSITIRSFNQAQLRNDYLTQDVYIGLFGTLSEDSIIQNLKVNYATATNSVVEIDLYQTFEEHPDNNIYFGGIAGKNLGIITNVQVSGGVKLEANNITAQLIDCGGITAINGDLSTESNKIATITNSTVHMSIDAVALVGGVAGTNNGKIVNTNFDGKILSVGATSYVSDVMTAGFVVDNTNGASISLSYVKFITVGENIRSVGNTAGFVLNNAGTINNCYISNAEIRTQGSIGGFVYTSSGSISNSYSYVQTANSLFYNKFIYDTSRIGDMTNCYYIAESANNTRVNGLKFVNSNQIETEEWKGFIFAQNQDDGLWVKDTSGPQLIGVGFNPNHNEYGTIYNIYDVETFEVWVGKSPLNGNDEEVVQSNKIENIKIRIVRDIDFEAEEFVGNPSTVNKILMADIEGNDMEIRGFTIYKINTDENYEQDFVGLFSKIEKAKIKNLILKPIEIKASTGYAVGVLAGAMHDVKLYNVSIDKNDMLVLGRNAVGGLAGIITGDFEIIGISSNVSVLATYKHGIGGQYNMYVGKTVTGIDSIDNIDKVSYAGTVAGIVDGYSNQTSQGDIDKFCAIQDIKVSGELVLAGENVGALFGLVGESTVIKNAHYTVSSNTKYQGAYISGGLVGENRGIIQGCSIIAEVVDDNRVSTEECFNNFARANGGIVGINVGGLIDNCTVDIDVCTNVKFATVGGVVGRNIGGSVYNTTIAGGKLKGYYVGGLVGADYTAQIMNMALTGESTVTIETLNVFRPNFVEYTNNTVTNGNFDNTKPFNNNKFNQAFMETFISNKTYVYNENYNNAGDRIVNASSLYGLVVGYTVNRYSVGEWVYDTSKGTHIEEDGQYVLPEIAEGTRYHKINGYKYVGNQMIVTLTLDTSYQPSKQYIVGTNSNNEDIIITCIEQNSNNSLKTLINEFNDDGDRVNILYLVAYEGEGYESWNSSSRYSNKFVIVGDLREYQPQ